MLPVYQDAACASEKGRKIALMETRVLIFEHPKAVCVSVVVDGAQMLYLFKRNY